MAVVFRAFDTLMSRTVAVKMLREEFADDEGAVRRFINESKAVAMLSHHNIVNIYDVSVRDNVKYIVMEYVEGITLKNYMTRRGILSFKEITSYTLELRVKGLVKENFNTVKLAEAKTKNIVAMLKALGADKKALIVTKDVDQMIVRASNNIPGVKTTFVGSLNVHDILDCDKFIISQDAVKLVEEVYAE